MNHFVGPVLPVRDEQAQACRDLWCAVILAAFSDATAPGKKGTLDQHQARKFFGSRRFYQICALAGSDAEYILRGYRDRMAELSANGHKAQRCHR